MERIEIKYKGHDIRFNENYDGTESWDCLALGLSEARLKTLRAKIDKWDLNTRKLPGVDVIVVRSRWGAMSEPDYARIMTIASDKEVWIQKKEKHRHKSGREKMDIDGLVYDTPENRRILEKIALANKEAAAIQAECKKMVSEMPGIKMADLRNIAAERLDDESTAETA